MTSTARHPPMRWFSMAMGVLLLATLSLRAEAQQTLQIGRVDFPSPLSDVAERVITEALRRGGMQVEMKRVPLLRSLALANDGTLDGELMRISDAVKDYPNLVAVPTPVTTIDIALYSMDAKLANLPRAEIAKRQVGLTRGTLSLVKHSKGMNVTDTQTISTTFDMLSNGRFDIAMMVFIDAELDLAQRKLTNIARRTQYWASEPLYFYLNKKNAALAPKINSALLEMSKEGLIKQYFAEGLKKNNINPLKPAD